MKMRLHIAIRATLGAIIVLSILSTFVSKILLHQYAVEVNEDGMPTLDE